MQNVVALHSFHAGYNVCRGVAFGVTYVQPRAGGVGEHVKHVILGFGKVVQIGMESAVLIPVFYPFFFYFVEISVSHNAFPVYNQDDFVSLYINAALFSKYFQAI